MFLIMTESINLLANNFFLDNWSSLVCDGFCSFRYYFRHLLAHIRHLIISHKTITDLLIFSITYAQLIRSFDWSLYISKFLYRMMFVNTTLTLSAAFFTDLAPSLTDSAASVTLWHASAVSLSFLSCRFCRRETTLYAHTQVIKMTIDHDVF